MTDQPRAFVLHAHLYQPPRTDPWFGEIEREVSAHPFHDWNARILAECYGPMSAARIADATGRITNLLNTFEHLSFDVGPTLLEWLEHAAPDVYGAIIDADAASAATHDGHGNAMAAPYHHTILPLASRRDKTTEVRWGIADFRRRFARAPEGMWLPETAVDRETLDVLAAEGIRFTVLAPHQIAGLPTGHSWGWYETASGGRIALFAYDGGASHAVAFGGALRDAAQWERDLLGTRRNPFIVATDGETYGHHHTFGEMALASLLARLDARRDVSITNCAWLAAQPHEAPVVDVVPNTSWSCEHGVERWRSECGCRMHPDRPTSQAWRAVLRNALEWLAGELHREYERESSSVFADPWGMRDAFGAVVGCGDAAALAFVREHTPDADAETRVRAAELLELERNALRMFTSCGWFFDDIAGLESRQVLRYAARALELVGPRSARLEGEFCVRLAKARSNDADAGTGDAIYRAGKPRLPLPVAAAGGVALASCGDVPVTDLLPHGIVLTAPPTPEDAAVVIREARTGRTHRLHVACGPAGGADATATVSHEDSGATFEVSAARLPEPARARLDRATREELVSRHFDEPALEQLKAGVPLPDVALEVLRAAVGQLLDRPAAPSAGRVLDLLHLAALTGNAVPYDVLTGLFRLWRETGGDPALEPLARYLRFG